MKFDIVHLYSFSACLCYAIRHADPPCTKKSRQICLSWKLGHTLLKFRVPYSETESEIVCPITVKFDIQTDRQTDTFRFTFKRILFEHEGLDIRYEWHVMCCNRGQRGNCITYSVLTCKYRYTNYWLVLVWYHKDTINRLFPILNLKFV